MAELVKRSVAFPRFCATVRHLPAAARPCRHLLIVLALFSTPCRAEATRRRVNWLAGWLALLLFWTLAAPLSTVFAQGTAFMYQGRLNDGGNPANGNYDLRFAIYDSTNDSGHRHCRAADQFRHGGQQRTVHGESGFWSGRFHRARPAGWTSACGPTAAPTDSPAQPAPAILTPTPYAIFANSASNLSGTLPQPS